MLRGREVLLVTLPTRGVQYLLEKVPHGGVVSYLYVAHLAQ